MNLNIKELKLAIKALEIHSREVLGSDEKAAANSLIGKLEDQVHDMEVEVAMLKAKIAQKTIKAACPWATDEAITEFLMEAMMDMDFSVESFKKYIMMD